MALAVQKYFEYKIKQNYSTSHLAISQQLLQVYQKTQEANPVYYQIIMHCKSECPKSCILNQNLIGPSQANSLCIMSYTTSWRKNSGSYQSSYKQNYYRVTIHTGHQSTYSTVLPLGSLLCLEAISISKI